MALLLALNFFSPHLLYAQGSQAGVQVENTAVVTYSIDTQAQSPIESSPFGNTIPGLGKGQKTVFTVDRKIDLLVTSGGNANVTLGDTQAELSFTVLNEGNDIQELILTLDSSLPSDNFDTNNCTVSVTAVSGSPLAGVILPTTDNVKLKADQLATISAKCDIPILNAGQAIQVGDTSLLSLIAVVEKNSDGSTTIETTISDSASVIDTVFSDGAGTDDALHDASHSSRGTYVALDSSQPAPPTLNIDKVILGVVDSQGGNTAVAGSEVTYEIKITSSGTGTINNVIITDPTPADMTYKASSLVLNNSSLSDGSDADSGDYGATTANTATVNLGTITAGNQHAIQLTYTID